VVDMFTAGTDNKSVYSSAPAGAAGGAVRRITELLKSSDMLESQTKAASKQVDGYKEQLTQLQDKMKQLMDRYIQQFAVMDNLVGEATSTRTSIKSTFDAMNASKND
jgi:flagellar hook-associated protein 2